MAALMQPKERVFDRVIVHMFEVFYATIVEKSKVEQSKYSTQPTSSDYEFFKIVPRGECLVLFITMVKEQCIGNVEIEVYTRILESILQRYCDDNGVDWQRVYHCEEFSTYIFGLFTLIFSHMKSGNLPMPELNSSMSLEHNPHRINTVLKDMLVLWQSQRAQELEVGFVR